MDDPTLAPLFAFLNSHDLADRDEWFTPDAFDAWVQGPAADSVLDIDSAARAALHDELLALAGDAPAAADDVGRAREVRDALLALVLDAPADGALDAVADDLDALVSALPLRMRVRPDGRIAVEPATRGPLAIAARALLLAHDAAVDGTWERIGACRAADCHWVFVDRSKNHSRQWCSMGDCGARAKARTYRARRRAGDPA